MPPTRERPASAPRQSRAPKTKPSAVDSSKTQRADEAVLRRAGAEPGSARPDQEKARPKDTGRFGA